MHIQLSRNLFYIDENTSFKKENVFWGVCFSHFDCLTKRARNNKNGIENGGKKGKDSTEAKDQNFAKKKTNVCPHCFHKHCNLHQAIFKH